MTDTFFDHATAPLRIGKVHLRVRDLTAVSAFYQQVIGLSVLEQGPRLIMLGGGAVPLLVLHADPAASLRPSRDAGLFHTAFLLPARADLSRWLRHAIRLGVPLHGASDHVVSEAIYLTDPEGNGIEVYADRPVAHWCDAMGRIHMATEPLDGPGLLAAGAGDWNGFPAKGIIGHVHLQVGDIDAAEGFYRDIMGFDIASRYPGASFFGSGGYHHYLAGNIWNSRSAAARPEGQAGLEMVEIVAREPVTRDAILERAKRDRLPQDTSGHMPILRDPWGTRITLVA